MMQQEQQELFEVGQLQTPQEALDFILAGNATFTAVSKRSGLRFTYKVKQKEGSEDFWFVSVLTGEDNETNYTYLGQIMTSYRTGLPHKRSYMHGRKSKIRSEATSARAFLWVWQVINGNLVDQWDLIEVWHEGRCGRCNRKLTVPDSIASGFGPECIQIVDRRPLRRETW